MKIECSNVPPRNPCEKVVAQGLDIVLSPENPADGEFLQKLVAAVYNKKILIGAESRIRDVSKRSLPTVLHTDTVIHLIWVGNDHST